MERVEIKRVSVTIVATGEVQERTQVDCPYNPEFVAEARKLNGKWRSDKRVWWFDVRDEQAIKDACKHVFGTDGSTPVATVDVRIKLDSYSTNDSDLWVCGRQVARRPGRDAEVRLGTGVVIVEGGFPPSGGSTKYPALRPDSGTVLEIRDVPFELAQKEIDGVTCLEVQRNQQQIDRKALAKEAENLRKRLAEIESLLGGEERRDETWI